MFLGVPGQVWVKIGQKGLQIGDPLVKAAAEAFKASRAGEADRPGGPETGSRDSGANSTIRLVCPI